MDTTDFGDIYAFTAIDIFTKGADVLLSPNLTAKYGPKFLFQSMGRGFDGHVYLIQTDSGSKFKADFLTNVCSFCDRHRVARPYRKNEQSYIESFNWTVRKECQGWQKYRVRDLAECAKEEVYLKAYQDGTEARIGLGNYFRFYNTERPHQSHGYRTPAEVHTSTLVESTSSGMVESLTSG